MRSITRISLGVVAAVLLLALATTNALAIPPNPHLFYGSISAGGSAVPAGAILQALGPNSSFCGQTTISTTGQYAISVNGDDPDNPSDPCQLTNGVQVTFRLSYGGQNQNLTPGATWQSGSSTNLALNFPSALPTPTPTNTPPPATNTPTPTKTPTPSATPQTFTRAFRGLVYNGSAYNTTNPQSGVTVTLYGSYNATDVGVFLRSLATGSSPDTGRYNLTYVVGGGSGDFTYYNILMNDPNWTALAAQSGSGGTAKAAHWIQFVRPSTTDLLKLDNHFWVKPASSGGTSTPTPTPTPSHTAPTFTPTPTVTKTPTGPTGTLCLESYTDTDGDGLRDEGEPALAGVAASVLSHGDGSGVTDGVTDGGGRVCWTLVQAQYRLLVTTPAGMEATGPTTWGILLGGSGTFNVPLGFRPEAITPTATATATATPTTAPGTGRIQGRVWEDRNQDQVIDSDEPGIPGVLITLRRDDGAVVTTTSTSEGSYAFFNITLSQDPDSMVVAETDPIGYVSTTPNEVSVQVSSAYPVTVHFGDVTNHMFLPMLLRKD